MLLESLQVEFLPDLSSRCSRAGTALHKKATTIAFYSVFYIIQERMKKNYGMES